MTPHNEASPGDYAETVLVPGDPLRAQWIAATFLESARCVNRVRGALGFTGFYRGKRVSVHGTGMGRPSFTIYVHELVRFYGVRIVIRTGSCGALTLDLPLRETFIAESAIMDTDLIAGGPAGHPDKELFDLALDRARREALPVHTGHMVSSDVFYHPTPETRFDLPHARDITAVDMETANLFTLSSSLGFRALSLCTIVDSLVTGEETPLSERHELFRGTAQLALAVAAAL
jgi:purine-nucleoside phosphorylase